MLECDARPLTSTCHRTGPLWASTIDMVVGSPTITIRGLTSECPNSAIIGRTPRHPISSSYENAMWIGVLSVRALNSGTAASTQAKNPFMSVAPRPATRSPRSFNRNGSLSHVCPSTGTTSVCPDSATPGTPLGPIVANRFAFSPSGDITSRLETLQ